MLESEDVHQSSRVFRSDDTTYDIDGHVAVTVDGEPVDIATWDTFYASLPVGAESVIGSVAYEILKKFGNQATTLYREFLDGSSVYDVVVTSHGTIDEERLTEIERRNFQQFVDNHTVVVMTGWNISDKGGEIAQTYSPDVVVTEGGSICHSAPSFEPQDLFDSLVSVEKGTAAIFKQIDRLLGKEAVLLSQANQASTCIYINPPKNLYEDELKIEGGCKNRSIENFCLQMAERTDVKPQPIRQEGHIGRFAYSEKNLYEFEKFQSQECTFQPYRILDITEDSVTFQLLSEEVFNQDDYSPLANGHAGPPSLISSIAFEAKERLTESVGQRIQPQTDYCIDVFAQRKEEALGSQFLDISGIDIETDNIIYLSKGTRSDLSLIDAFVEQADKYGTKFAGKATTDAPSEIRNHPYVAEHDVDSPAKILADIESSNRTEGPIPFSM